MQLILCSEDIAAYLEETEIINFHHPSIREKIEEFQYIGKNKLDRAQLAYHFVRDRIQHSFDRESTRITISASDTLEQKAGVCLAKSHLLAALLRGMGIPTGLCYQNVTKLGEPESIYELHGLNAVYINELYTWFRVDPIGNTPEVKSGFSISHEILAYPIQRELDKIESLYVYSKPAESVISSMKQSTDFREFSFNSL
jgi:transglutaminase-like putative cysteine protease